MVSQMPQQRTSWSEADRAALYVSCGSLDEQGRLIPSTIFTQLTAVCSLVKGMAGRPGALCCRVAWALHNCGVALLKLCSCALSVTLAQLPCQVGDWDEEGNLQFRQTLGRSELLL